MNRKPNRLPKPNYDQPGAYFITVCTDAPGNIFWEGASLSPWGKLLDQVIRDVPRHYAFLTVDHYVIMPDHVHLLLRIHAPGGKGISTVVQQMKGALSKAIGRSIWQKGFYDHIIRNDADYIVRWKYIDGNIPRWQEKHQRS